MSTNDLKRKLAIISSAVVRGKRSRLTDEIEETTIRTKPNFNQHYKERFEAQRRLAQKVAGSLEVNEILERMREETKALIPSAMEACILLLDPEAPQYTRPLQCALYERPVNCLSCKRNRPAIQKAIRKGGK